MKKRPEPLEVAWEVTTAGRVDSMIRVLGASDLRFEVHPTTEGGCYSQEWRVSAVFYAEDKTEVRHLCTFKGFGFDNAVERAARFVEQERLLAALPAVEEPARRDG